MDPNYIEHDANAGCPCVDCCKTRIIYGCTDPTAFNYSSAANVDDGSCIPTISGCTDPNANNYNSNANVNDGSCE